MGNILSLCRPYMGNMGNMHNKNPRLSNIPLWNLRDEFHLINLTVRSPGFEHALNQAQVKPIVMPLFDWKAGADELLTLIVQREVLGS